MMYATMTNSGSDHRWPDGGRFALLAAPPQRRRPLRKIGAPMLCCMTANTQPAPRRCRRRPPGQKPFGKQQPGWDFRTRHFSFGSAHHEAAAQPGLHRAVFRRFYPRIHSEGVMLLACSRLYVGTDISEKANRTRFYDESGKEIGARLESVNDLPGANQLAEEALSRVTRIGAKEILGLDPGRRTHQSFGCNSRRRESLRCREQHRAIHRSSKRRPFASCALLRTNPPPR